MTSNRLRYISDAPTDHWVALLATKTVRECEDMLLWLNCCRPELSETYVEECQHELSRTAEMAQEQVSSRIVKALNVDEN